MERLAYIIVFTGDVARMRRFYEDGLGLAAREQSPEWVELDTAGATLVLSQAPDPARRGIELRFFSDEIEARVADLAAHGVAFDPPGIERLQWGKIARLKDAEGNRLTLWQPAWPIPSRPGPVLSAAINCRDMAVQRAFYHDLMGFEAPVDSPWWVQLAAGEAGLGLHPRGPSGGNGGEGHHGSPITIGLSVPDLGDWHDERSALGMRFTAPPTDRGYGTLADAMDPDGNPVSIREAPEPSEPETLEEQLAVPFEEEDTPRRAAIRKPVKKGAKATSRVATRPGYRSKAAPGRRRVSKPAARVASPRGTGPAGTRKKPKRKHDPKRARTKPATGRRQKAERRTFKSQKQAIAGASRRKPVKRASRARTAKRRVARRGGARR
jgi:catechol 2,3-dioxygenase-like lactoylglutathione lyase family enzyme